MHRIAEFYRHLLVYVIVISLVWILNVIVISTSTRLVRWSSLWAICPTLGWGVGVLVHGITVRPAWRFFSQKWEDRKVKELMEKERQ
ncbi:MAG: 2TM domain-containing protein [Betaproteobacteria bacterium]|nr:2TM domain-containing protein [Betaproteobacteria bacterium]